MTVLDEAYAIARQKAEARQDLTVFLLKMSEAHRTDKMVMPWLVLLLIISMIALTAIGGFWAGIVGAIGYLMMGAFGMSLHRDNVVKALRKGGVKV